MECVQVFPHWSVICRTDHSFALTISAFLALTVSVRPAVLFVVALLFIAESAFAQSGQDLAQQVEIRRTDYGVPHILGENYRAAGFGLGYAQAEDYTEQLLRLMVSAKGELSKALGPDHLESDVRSRQRHAIAVATYDLVDERVRAVKEGFAEGVNYFIRMNPDRVPEWAEPNFTGHDVAARDIGWADASSVRRFVRMLEEGDDPRIAPDDYESRPQQHTAPEEIGTGHTPDPGSNAWALAPERTVDGHAILVRNPHLSWQAGYYEAQFTIPGEVNFYGDFRVGGPFTTIGGFNEYTSSATTNNNPPSHEIYALEVDPATPDHYLFDGATHPVQRELFEIEFKNGPGFSKTVREALTTSIGPVIHRGHGHIYVIKAGNHGAFRVGEQFLGIMLATNLEEFEQALRVRAHPYSNFTYADREGNIHYAWTGTVPLLPHAAGGDTLAIPARTSADVWSELVPFEIMPSLTNPRGGYIRNENDPFHLTNLYEPIADDHLPDYFPEASLRLRSLHGLELLHNDRSFTLEEAIDAKHSMRMLLAERVKGDLLEAVRRIDASLEVAEAAAVLAAWDDSVAPEARGAVLFANWWQHYRRLAGSGIMPFEQDPAIFRTVWTIVDPVATPQGLANFDAAVAALAEAAAETREQWGSMDVEWGEVHRARLADVDLPVGGCHGALGCLRVLWFRDGEDGRQVVSGGDGWTFAVEMSETPRAYSINAYGQSNDPDSPHHTDQLQMFVDHEMKPVRFTEGDIRANLIRSYRPGEERRIGSR
jgi:acyl-homoserine-lactone acylase